MQPNSQHEAADTTTTTTNTTTTENSTSLALPKQTQLARVLVLEDDTRVFTACQQALQPEGFVVIALDSCEKAIESLQHRLFDLVLLGGHASLGERLELLERMRQHAIDVPIILMVDEPADDADSSLDPIARAVKVGIQGLLVKPLQPAHIHATVTEVLERHQRDTTQRWQTIQQLVHTEKLAAIGRLVTAIAHEMNNPLQGLYNALNLIRRNNRSFSNRKRQQYLAMAQDEVENLITVVRRMLECYRPSMEGMRPTNMHSLLEGALRLVDQQLGTSKISVLRDWSPRLPHVFAISSRLKQACLQLITNAIESMPNGGVLTVRTYISDGTEYQFNAGFQFAQPMGSVGHLVRGPSVVIEISDTGVGIAADELPKIFEPFYTTRFKARGLGLAISYSIVEQHLGELSVSSAEGKGTTFRVRLPAASET